MVSPKEARRRQQLLARERKRVKAEKQWVKNVDRKMPAFEAVFTGWLNLDRSEFPRREPCPGGCGLDVGVRADGDELVHNHEYPPCAAYKAYARASDAAWDAVDRKEGGISKDEVLERMVPAWTHGPSTEIPEAMGAALLASGTVLKAAEIGGGMIKRIAYALTAKGLFTWSVTEDDDWEDEEPTEEDREWERQDHEDSVRSMAAEIFGDEADDWLGTKHAALGGKAPLDMLNTFEGCEAIEDVLRSERKSPATADDGCGDTNEVG